LDLGRLPDRERGRLPLFSCPRRASAIELGILTLLLLNDNDDDCKLAKLSCKLNPEFMRLVEGVLVSGVSRPDLIGVSPDEDVRVVWDWDEEILSSDGRPVSDLIEVSKPVATS